MIPRGRILERSALLIGVLALIALTFLGPADPERSLAAYRLSLLFWTGLSLGSLTWLALHFLVGGAWGAVGRSCFEASGRMIGWMGLLFVPLLFGLGWIYPWARPEAGGQSALLEHRALYLNGPFFIGRTIFYFVIWTVLGRQVTALSRRVDSELSLYRPLRTWSTAWLLVYLVTASWAAIDWVVSSEPRWNSSIFGLLTIAGQMLSAIALCSLVVGLLARLPEIGGLRRLPLHLNDLGNLLLVGVMTWGYLEYSQLLIVWSGNLPDEAGWYVTRVGGGWHLVAWAVFALQLALPFAMLLFRSIKRHPSRLAGVGTLVLAAHLLYRYWQLMPPYVPAGPLVQPVDVLAVVGVGGLWIGGFLWHLDRRSRLVPADPRLGTEVAHA